MFETLNVTLKFLLSKQVKSFFLHFQIFCSTVFLFCHLACLECRKRAKKDVNVEEGTNTLPQQSQPAPVTSEPQTAISIPTTFQPQTTISTSTTSQPSTCLMSTPTTCQNGTLLLINTPSVQRVPRKTLVSTTAPTTTTTTTFSPLFGTLIVYL